jgi:hypothetical protein
MLNAKLVRQLAREVRSCSGAEKTPEQIENILLGRFKRPVKELSHLLTDADACQAFAHDIRLAVDDLPDLRDIIQGN